MIERMGRATLREISIRTTLLEHRVRYTLRCLHAEKLVHISAWATVPGKRRDSFVPLYALGYAADAPPPKGATHRTIETSPLDYNPGAALQQVTLLWGQSNLKDHEHAEVIAE